MGGQTWTVSSRPHQPVPSRRSEQDEPCGGGTAAASRPQALACCPLCPGGPTTQGRLLPAGSGQRARTLFTSTAGLEKPQASGVAASVLSKSAWPGLWPRWHRPCGRAWQRQPPQHPCQPLPPRGALDRCPGLLVLSSAAPRPLEDVGVSWGCHQAPARGGGKAGGCVRTDTVPPGSVDACACAWLCRRVCMRVECARRSAPCGSPGGAAGPSPKTDVGTTPVPTRVGLSVRCERGSRQVRCA